MKYEKIMGGDNAETTGMCWKILIYICFCQYYQEACKSDGIQEGIYLRQNVQWGPKLADLTIIAYEETTLLNEPLSSRHIVLQYQDKRERAGPFLKEADNGKC